MLVAQLFDKPFYQVEKQLSRLKKLGVTHVLVSPPQKSHSSDRWWGRYQPVDFTRVEGPLGNGDDLYRLCGAARKLGMSVVADTVIHHLSNESRWVRIRGNRIISAQYPRFCHNDLRGLHQPGRGRGLPILDTQSLWVRSELRNYLRMLYDIGVRGFRFDSAKHIDPHLFPYLLKGLPPLFNFGELVYQEPDHFPREYWQSMKAYDFPLAHSIHRAFSWNGDLGSLLHPKALWGPHSVAFVNHHDLTRNRRGFSPFRVANLEDRKIAYAYLLSCGHGVPLVYGPDIRYREVKAAMKFHSQVLGWSQTPVAASKTHLVFRRGDSALVGLNKSGRPQEITAEIEPGTYRDLATGWESATNHGRLHWVLPARSATLLLKQY